MTQWERKIGCHVMLVLQKLFSISILKSKSNFTYFQEHQKNDKHEHDKGTRLSGLFQNINVEAQSCPIHT